MSRRRRNPSFAEVNSLVTLGLVAGAGYVFYKYIWPLMSATGNAVGKAADTISQPFANAYVYLTSDPAAQVQGSAVLSTGGQVSMQDIAAGSGLTKVPNSNPVAFSFQWNGQTYIISGPRDANGNYAATLVPFGVTDSGW